MKDLLNTENRQYLMGIGILLITLHHLALYGGGYPFSLFIGGNIGVDIFFFLSIIGCCFSLERRNVAEFYKCRALRIYPMYVLFLVVLLSLFYRNESLVERTTLFLVQISGLSIFNEFRILAWYIPSTIVLYLCVPLVFKIVKPLSKLRFFYLMQLVGLWLLLLIENRLTIYLNGALAVRLPILYVGLLTYLNLDNEKCLIGVYIVSVLFAFFMPNMNALTRASLVLPLVIFGFSKIDLPEFGKKIIFFFGKHSLEIYLAQYIAIGTLFADRSYAVFVDNLRVQIILALLMNSVLAFCLYRFDRFIKSYVR